MVEYIYFNIANFNPSVLCCAKSLYCVQLFVTLWTTARQAPLSVGILQARILQWVAMLSSPGDLADPGIEPASTGSLPLAPPGRPLTHLIW